MNDGRFIRVTSIKGPEPQAVLLNVSGIRRIEEIMLPAKNWKSSIYEFNGEHMDVSDTVQELWEAIREANRVRS